LGEVDEVDEVEDEVDEAEYEDEKGSEIESDESDEIRSETPSDSEYLAGSDDETDLEEIAMRDAEEEKMLASIEAMDKYSDPPAVPTNTPVFRGWIGDPTRPINVENGARWEVNPAESAEDSTQTILEQQAQIAELHRQLHTPCIPVYLSPFQYKQLFGMLPPVQSQ
jgi:hypothetical protein